MSSNSKVTPPCDARPAPTRSSGSTAGWSGTSTPTRATRSARSFGRTEPGARYLCFAPTPTCVYHVATHRSLYGSVDAAARAGDVPAVRTVAFLTGLDSDPADLGMVSVNGAAPFGSPRF